MDPDHRYSEKQRSIDLHLPGHVVHSGTQLAKITYGWDKDDNLTTKTTVGTTGAGTNTYGYDHTGRLTSWTAPGDAVTSYEWDASGNRTKAGSATYTYDERNRLTSGDGTDSTYTPRGTLATSTKAGTTTSYTFDAFDRMIADGDSLYAYDALDRVASRIRGMGKQTFAYSGLGNDLAALTDTSTGGLVARYARDADGGLLGLKEGAGAAAATLTDLHGDLVATVNSTGLTTSTAYDPFGAVTAQTGAKSNLGYQSEYTDPDTGKANMHARWYQPGAGTFVSRDTTTLAPAPSVQANHYTYANATPLTGADPTGHATEPSTSWNSGGTSGWGDTSAGYSGDPCSALTVVAVCGGGSGSSIGDGGGSIACSGAALNICGAPDFSVVAKIDRKWYYDNFVRPTIPVFDDEEAERIGVLPNGSPLPKNMKDFWKRSAAERDRWTAVAPYISESDYEIVWKAAKDVSKSRKAMKAYATFAKNVAAGKTVRIELTLKRCDNDKSLRTSDCKKLIKREWENQKAKLCAAITNTPDCGGANLTTVVASVFGMPVDLFAFLAKQPDNLTLGELSTRVRDWAAKVPGVKCSWNSATGLNVCTGLEKSYYGRGGITIGHTYLTGKEAWQVSPGRLKHEAKHMEQGYWYANRTGQWYAFLVYYLNEPLDPCKNNYERQADAVYKTYSEC
ncbi:MULTISPECIES: RHS repeat-associated core domain-containing protein [unclassified Nonomuraea]|uniref:RHS repeat domain-containing protein n=1 Tax=unclassified Nonomuraea TaxID=2593643 RepID=UPI0033C13A64